MNGRFIPAFVVTLFMASGGLRAADESSPWPTDYSAALKEAAATNRPILANFTGSDWCHWCILLVKDTFSQPKFTAFAKENLVLLEVDFPQGKEQSEAVKKQNEELQKKFGVEGYPTLILIDKDGKEIARHVGYLKGGPDAMISWIKNPKATP